MEHPVLAAALILSQIALQFNQSITLPKSSTSPFDGPSPTSRAINSLFYTSLGFSLANVTIGLLCLQWLRELKAESPGIPRQGYPAFRYNRHLGFQVWGAKGTILALPLLLLASLLSFFVALLFLTSSMDWLSSSPLYIILVSVLFFVLATTVIPGLVAVKYGAFHVGFSDVAPSPPFRSLQSWIVLQGLVKLIALYYRTIKRTARHRFVEISLCPDWGRIDQLWAGWANGRRDASMILPLVLSTGKKEDQEAIYQCYSDTYSKFEKPPPGGKRLDIYRKFVRYGRRLPAPTLKQVEDQLVSHVAALLNSGRSLQDIGGLGIEVNMDMFYITSGARFPCENLRSILMGNSRATSSVHERLGPGIPPRGPKWRKRMEFAVAHDGSLRSRCKPLRDVPTLDRPAALHGRSRSHREVPKPSPHRQQDYPRSRILWIYWRAAGRHAVQPLHHEESCWQKSGFHRCEPPSLGSCKGDGLRPGIGRLAFGRGYTALYDAHRQYRLTNTRRRAQCRFKHEQPDFGSGRWRGSCFS